MNTSKNLIEKISQRIHPYVIAEIGINHNGSINLAKEMIDAAADNEADCVKFQSFRVDKYISPIAGKADYQKQDDFDGLSQSEIIKSCELTIEEVDELQKYSNRKNIDFLSTPFEVWSLRELISVKVPAIKVSSCNLTNIPFLEETADSGLPVLLSTGMASMEEVLVAVRIFKKKGSPLMLFQCTSNYPSDPKNANLRVLNTYKKLFDVPVGLSDHTKNNITCIAATALGASAIEKHFTVSRQLPGIDQKASIEPQELKDLVYQLRECKKALGSPIKFRTDEEENTAVALRRSIVASRDIKSGEVLDKSLVMIMRPGNGLEPDYLPRLSGKKFTRSIKKGDLLSLDDFLPF
jgi:sialic acid synthase SpsE